jgi:hypothetical protein
MAEFVFKGRVSGNNIRYKFPKDVTQKMTEEMKTSLEVEMPDNDYLASLSHLELPGVFKIGSPVTVTINIQES